MEFGSINRRLKKPRTAGENQVRCRARRSFSTSNLSFRTTSSVTSLGRRSVYLTLPKELECEIGPDGRVLHMLRGGPAHASGVIQIGDYVRIFKGARENGNDTLSSLRDVVTVHVLYGVLQVDTRPQCPFVIKIGNRSNTALGIAVGDGGGKKIKISSIQSGSLADRCGFLVPGDVISSIEINPQERIHCSPYYTCYQIAQILRKLASTQSSVTLTIVPLEELESSDDNSACTSSTLRHSTVFSFLKESRPSYSSFLKSITDKGRRRGSGYERGSIVGMRGAEVDETKRSAVIIPPESREQSEDEGSAKENTCVLSLCLWKDRLYEDWGFSLVDTGNNSENLNDVKGGKASVGEAADSKILGDGQVSNVFGSPKSRLKFFKNGAFVHQIRPGGPAFTAGLLPGDRILRINERDVKNLESTILVPILASLDDALNLVVARRV